MDIEQQIRNIGNLYPFEVTEDKSNFWEHAFELVRKNANFVFNKKNIIKLRRILLDNLLHHGSDDFKTVKRVMDTCALRIWWNSICKRHRRRIFSNILNPSNGFSGIHKKCTFSALRLLDAAISLADVDLMTLLVKYGLFEIPSGNSLIFHDISQAEIMLNNFW